MDEDEEDVKGWFYDVMKKTYFVELAFWERWG